jgi:hypothetical protein
VQGQQLESTLDGVGRAHGGIERFGARLPDGRVAQGAPGAEAWFPAEPEDHRPAPVSPRAVFTRAIELDVMSI